MSFAKTRTPTFSSSARTIRSTPSSYRRCCHIRSDQRTSSVHERAEDKLRSEPSSREIPKSKHRTREFASARFLVLLRFFLSRWSLKLLWSLGYMELRHPVRDLAFTWVFGFGI